MRIVFGAALTLLMASAAYAELESCAALETDLDRLACYDRVAGRTAVSVSEEAAGAWSVQIKKSDFEDTTDVYLQLASEEAVGCGQFRAPETATLVIRCMENTTSIFFATSCHLTSGHGGYGDVDVRLDEEKSFTIAMDESTNNRSLGHWSGGKAIPFIKKMVGKKRMIIRFTPYNESATTAAFNLIGLDDAITPLRESCKW